VSTVPAELNPSLLTAEVETVYRVAYRLTGDRHDAEDLVQDVCERALRKAPEFAAAEDCRRWLLRVLYNRFVDGARHRRRSPIVASPSGFELSPTAGVAAAHSKTDAADPADLAVQAEEEAVLACAWARLEPDQQMLLLLRAEGHELGEIARITDIDKPALSSRLHRARASLAKYLEEERSAQPLRAISEKAR
jgi:RNA polymerase sigma factor (sigma-70 family)